jgi:hypothetical protein
MELRREKFRFVCRRRHQASFSFLYIIKKGKEETRFTRKEEENRLENERKHAIKFN